MFHNNKELRNSLMFLGIASALFAVTGFWLSWKAGILLMAFGATAFGIHMGTEFYRYRKLQELSSDLDRMLISGTPLPIHAYKEGELSILANHIQKLTMRLTETTAAIQEEKTYLADSLADISHQLRTPLTAMNLTTSMLRAQPLADKRRMELTGELRNLLARTDWLVDTLLKISKLDAGTVKLAKQVVDIRQLIARSAAPVAIAMELRSQALQVISHEQNLTCDPVWTAEALGNILKNCMEHTPEGGSITVTATDTPLYTQITLEDTGDGFDTKDIPHLFERFYRGSNATQNSYGIGLALARTIITAQNGTIRAMNTGKGAKFIVKFYKQII